MKKSEKAFRLLKEKQLIGLLTPETGDQCIRAYEILSPLGVTLEIAFRSEVAMEGIASVMKKYPDAIVLAGTVMTRGQAEQAIGAGVSGVVSADYISAVVEVCVRNDIMCVPGGLGDVGKQLAQKAELCGCAFEALHEKVPYQWIHKLFPARTKTQSYVELTRAWKGPFKGLTIVYTGGVNGDNLSEIVGFDPDGIFCGSALTKEIEHPTQMREEAEKWVSVIQNTKKGS